MFQFHGKQKAARVNRGRRFVAIVISQVSIQPRCTRYESLEIAGHDHAVTVDRFYGRIWPHPALQKLDIVQVQGAEYDFDVGYSLLFRPILNVRESAPPTKFFRSP